MDNARFNQLLDLARNGDESSVAQLWHEFGFDFHAEYPPADSVSSVSSVVNSPSAPPRLCEESLTDTCHPTPETCSLEGGI